MRKGKIGCIGVVLVVLGLLLWGVSQIRVRAPRGGVIHIETPGGPVPMGITFFDEDWAVIDVRNGDRATNEPLVAGRDQDFLVRKFEWASPSFEIEFHREQTVLVMDSVEDEGGKYKAVGKLIVRDDRETVSEFEATMPKGMDQNWFDISPTAEEEVRFEAFGARWDLEFLNSNSSGMLDIQVYRKVIDNTPVPDIPAVLLCFETKHRNFAGRISGNRIRLASFDNAYPALIHATIQDDGTLKGDLWVGDRLHETFTATKQ
ncbi:MAG: hypothetical protein AB8C13_08905 [Phycisphaerales bacterium]